MVRFGSIMCVLSLCAMLPLIARPVMTAGDMLEFEMGLLFTVVAFQLIISTYVPISSTMSVFDMYGAFLFLHIFGTMASISVASIVSYDSNSPEAEFPNPTLHFIYLFGIWAVAHIYFLGAVFHLTRKRKAELVKSKEDNQGTAYEIIQPGDLTVPICGKVVSVGPRRPNDFVEMAVKRISEVKRRRYTMT